LSQLGEGQAGQLACPVGGPVHRRVMQDHQPAVGGDPQVQLDLVGALRFGPDERPDRVLRLDRPRPAVSDHAHRAIPDCPIIVLIQSHV
jgi:hypothetical protein